MKKEFTIWLPPQGDDRLLHFQQETGRLRGEDGFLAHFPFVTSFSPEPFPQDAVRVSLGPWVWHQEFLCRRTNLDGWYCFLAFAGETPWDEGALPCPEFSWDRGRTGRLTWEGPGSGCGWVNWQLSTLTPWRPCRG